MTGTSETKRPASRGLRAAAGPIAKTALLRLGGYAALRSFAPSHGLAILRYHAVCEPRSDDYADPSICVTPAQFERHVAYLTRAYTILRLEDAVDMLAARRALPKNAIVLTFDDGYADNLAASRILKKYGATATFYITAGCLADGEPFWPVEVRYVVRALPASRMAVTAGPVHLELDLTSGSGRQAAVKVLTKTYKAHPIAVRDELRSVLRARAGRVEAPRVMLTYDEVREMRALGMTIGSHTMTHPNLPNAGAADARRELVQSKARLEQELDAPVTMFSYPNGGAERYMTPEIAAIVRDVGFAAATTSWNGFAGPVSDLYALERVQIGRRLEDLIFAIEIERFAFRPVPRSAQR
jgi:peptidoglycan/xylan/chitin deacetylase (PgdA/CDA1 family)